MITHANTHYHVMMVYQQYQWLLVVVHGILKSHGNCKTQWEHYYTAMLLVLLNTVLQMENYTFSGCDSYGDGWNGATASFYVDGSLVAVFDGPGDDLDAEGCLATTITVGGAAVVSGCTDMDACNYDATATLDDGSCEYPDCNGDCDGDAVVDQCGVCDGDGTSCQACIDAGGNMSWIADGWCDNANNISEVSI